MKQHDKTKIVLQSHGMLINELDLPLLSVGLIREPTFATIRYNNINDDDSTALVAVTNTRRAK